MTVTFCRILFREPGGTTMVRAATVVDPDVLLTAKHGIPDRQRVTIDAGDGTPHVTGLVRHSAHDDLAFVVADRHLPDAVPMEVGPPAGSDAALLGWTGRRDCANVRAVDSHLHYETDGRGLSGFALVQHGTLVGVQSQHVRDTTYRACRALDAIERAAGG